MLNDSLTLFNIPFVLVYILPFVGAGALAWARLGLLGRSPMAAPTSTQRPRIVSGAALARRWGCLADSWIVNDVEHAA